ncbi:MAG TPA: hypothetical protein VIH99_09980 [Bdellovibrionota bacterium]|jgi:hypothetical protein
MDTVVNLSPSDGSLRETLRKCLRVLVEPGRFFRNDLPAMSVNDSLAFGIGNAWAAAVISFFIQTINSFLLAQLLERWMQRLVASEDGFSVWTLSAKSFLYASGMLLLAPFLLLLRSVISAAGLYLFARLLIEDRPESPEPVTYNGALRIQGSVLCGQWFSVVPIFGGVLAFLVSLILSVTGVRERFGVSNRRALAVVLAPYILLGLAMLLFFAVFALALSQISLQELLDVDPRDLGL